MIIIKNKFFCFTLMLGLISTIILLLSFLSGKDSSLEREQFSIYWPERILSGESETIQILVKLDRDFLSNSNLSEINDFQKIISLDAYYVNLEARVEMAGIDVNPSGVISKNILPGQKISFTWVILGKFAGDYQGTVWLYMNLIPKESSEKTLKEIILAKPINIQVHNFLGLRIIFVRVIMSVLIFVSIIVALFIAHKTKSQLNQN